MKQFFFLSLVFFSLLTSKVHSATITAITDGDWTNTTIWSLGRQPQSGDDIIIPASRSVTVPLFEGVDLTGPETTTLTVMGVLDFTLSDITIDSGDGDSIIIPTGGSIVPNGAVYFDSRFNDPVFITVFSGAVNGPAKIENGVLPIVLVSFDAISSDNQIILQWSTASEINNDYFTILRSSNGITYDTLVTIPGAGNSSIKLDYSYTDTNPLNGRSYYRIQQTDYNGDFELFDPISVDFITNSNRILSFNNPVLRGGIISIKLEDVKEVYSLSIININGQIEYTSSVLENNVKINIDSNTKPGLYLVKIVGYGFTESARLLIQ